MTAAGDAVILQRLSTLTDSVEAIQRGQDDLRKAIESGSDSIQVRLRVLEDRVQARADDAVRLKEQQAALRGQLIATIVGVVLTAIGGGIAVLL